MRKTTLLIIFAFLSVLSAEAVKIIDINPINLAAVIVEKVDSVKIVKEFEYYGYTLQGTEDGYKVMKGPNGNEIKYSLDKESISYYHSTVIVKSNETPTEIDSKLKDMRLYKKGDKYSRIADRDERYIIQCTHGPSNTLIFKSIRR